jgi:hypothetical protein
MGQRPDLMNMQWMLVIPSAFHEFSSKSFTRTDHLVGMRLCGPSVVGCTPCDVMVTVVYSMYSIAVATRKACHMKVYI